jgi:hypothetical protein
MGRVTNNTKWFSHFCYELMTFFLREHKEWLGLKICPYKIQSIFDLWMFSWMFQHPVASGVDTEI